MAALDEIAGVLGFSRASHLLRRLTFGATRAETDAFSAKSISDALATLLSVTPAPQTPEDLKSGMPWIVPGSQNSSESDLRQYFRCWLYGLMFNTSGNATEKMTFFLHTNFTAISTVVEKSTALYYQNQLLRKYTTGNIKELALKICKDNAMLVLLDNRLNVNAKPNENYAREFLELYTIGKGKELSAGNYTTYTEQDVQAAARVLSGWDTDFTYSTIDPVTGIPSGKLKLSGSLASKHDAGSKIFSAAFDNNEIKPSAVSGSFATAEAAEKELSDMVDMIFSKRATALNICRKIYRFFVYYRITDQVEIEVISPMADNLIANNYNLKPVFELLFKSKHFFDEDDIITQNNVKGAIIKSPLEVTIGMMKHFNIKLPDPSSDLPGFYKEVGSVLDAMTDQGFDLYEPLDVAGYDAYFQAPLYNRNWISPNYLARRFQFAQYIIEGKTSSGKDSVLKLDAINYVKNPSNVSDPSNGDILPRELIKYLFPENITDQRYLFFQNILLDNLSVINWKNEWNNYTASGDDMAVRMQVNAFLNAVLQSAEYQLS